MAGVRGHMRRAKVCFRGPFEFVRADDLPRPGLQGVHLMSLYVGEALVGDGAEVATSTC